MRFRLPTFYEKEFQKQMGNCILRGVSEGRTLELISRQRLEVHKRVSHQTHQQTH